jgi:hypothetical protein
MSRHDERRECENDRLHQSALFVYGVREFHDLSVCTVAGAMHHENGEWLRARTRKSTICDSSSLDISRVQLLKAE